MSFIGVFLLLCHCGGVAKRVSSKTETDILSFDNYGVANVPKCVVIGKTRAGKSNLLSWFSSDLKIFEAGDGTDSFTEDVKKVTVDWFGSGKYGKVTFLDTPGAYDTYGRDQKLLEKIIKGLKAEGSITRFLWVIKAGEPADGSTLQSMVILRAIIGPELWQYVDIIETFCTKHMFKKLPKTKGRWLEKMQQIEGQFSERQLDLSHLEMFGLNLDTDEALERLKGELNVVKLCFSEPEQVAKDEWLKATCGELTRVRKRLQKDAEGAQLDTHALENPITVCFESKPPHILLTEITAIEKEADKTFPNLAKCAGIGIDKSLRMNGQEIPGRKDLKQLYEKDAKFSQAVAFRARMDGKLDAIDDFLPSEAVEVARQYPDFRSWDACQKVENTQEKLTEHETQERLEEFAQVLKTCVTKAPPDMKESLGRRWRNHLGILEKVLGTFDGDRSGQESRKEIEEAMNVRFEALARIQCVVKGEEATPVATSEVNLQRKLKKDQIKEVETKCLDEPKLKERLGFAGSQAPKIAIRFEDGETRLDAKALQLFVNEWFQRGSYEDLRLIAEIEIPESDGLREISQRDKAFKEHLQKTYGWKANFLADSLVKDQVNTKQGLLLQDITEKTMPETFKCSKKLKVIGVQQDLSAIKQREYEEMWNKKRIQKSKKLEDIQKMKEQYQKMIAEVEKAREDLAKDVANAQKEASSSAKVRLGEVLQQLKAQNLAQGPELSSFLKMKPQEMEEAMAKMAKGLEGTLKSVEAPAYTAMEMIDGFGILHGRLLGYPIQPYQMKAQDKVVQIKKSVKLIDLLKLPTSTAEAATTLRDVTFTSETGQQWGETLLDEGGFSLGASVFAKGAGATSTGVGTFSALATVSYANSQKKDVRERGAKKKRELAKMMVVLAPKAKILISENDVELLPHVQEELREISILNGAERKDRLERFMDKKGSHVCLKVMLGGTLKSKATFEEEVGSGDKDFKTAATNEFNAEFSSTGQYCSLSGLVEGGVGAQVHSHKSNGEQQHEASHQSKLKKILQNTYVGGQAGLPPPLWLESLASTNRNWRIIDHGLDDCTPIWELLDSELQQTLSADMFKQWSGRLRLPEGINKISPKSELQNAVFKLVAQSDSSLRHLQQCDDNDWCNLHGSCIEESGKCNCMEGYQPDSCAACQLGYDPQGQDCRLRTCKCDHGIPATGLDCKESGADICFNCTSGYWMGTFGSGKCEKASDAVMKNFQLHIRQKITHIIYWQRREKNNDYMRHKWEEAQKNSARPPPDGDGLVQKCRLGSK